MLSLRDGTLFPSSRLSSLSKSTFFFLTGLLLTTTDFFARSGLGTGSSSSLVKNLSSFLFTGVGFLTLTLSSSRCLSSLNCFSMASRMSACSSLKTVMSLVFSSRLVMNCSAIFFIFLLKLAVSFPLSSVNLPFM